MAVYKYSHIPEGNGIMHPRIINAHIGYPYSLQCNSAMLVHWTHMRQITRELQIDTRSPGIFDMQLRNTVYIQSTCTHSLSTDCRTGLIGPSLLVVRPAGGQGSGEAAQTRRPALGDVPGVVLPSIHALGPSTRPCYLYTHLRRRMRLYRRRH